jgi:thiol-disulfide isomerase/thioredoxin
MDRLPAVTRSRRAADAPAAAAALALALIACSPSGDGGAPPERVNAVKADPKRAASLEGFCDVRPGPGAARAFALPELAAGGPAPPAVGGRWLWMNVWATWCAPCVEEMPMLAKWRSRLADDGVRFELAFLTVDGAAADVERFRERHPDTPPTLRIRDGAGLEPFATSLGLDASAAIPIHVFVDPAGKIQCVRTGGLTEPHYATVRELLRSPAPAARP